MTRQTRSLAALACVLGFCMPLPAERVPLSPAQKAKEATHIVTGTVQAVYTRERVTDSLGRGTVETHIALEILIGSMEKGDGYKPGDVVYGRCFRVKRAPALPAPGPSGHHGVPAEGAQVKVYLQRMRDGGFDVVYPNGVETLAKGKESPAGHRPK